MMLVHFFPRMTSVLLVLVVWASGQAVAAELSQPDPVAHPNVFLWTDTCNVWVLRDGDAALLIDLGDGSVLEQLPKLGVKRVEWVLFTHHHREQCQGAPRLAGSETKIGAPAAERALFEKPTDFRKMQVRLQDAFTIHGASYVRPPIQPIAIDRAFEKMDTFQWRGHEFWCIDTKGNSPGAMSYLLRTNSGWLAFSGDVMLDGAKLHTWFDSEWDYGFAAGVWSLANSAGQVAGYDPEWLLPSHGPAIRRPAKQLSAFQDKLRRFEKLLIRGYPVSTFSGAAQDRLSRPTKVPHVWQVSPHVYKFRGPDYYPNFYLIIADSGRGLAIDCGLIKPEVLDQAIIGMREHLGLKGIDAVIPTHMHGDHFLQAPHLRENWGTEIWALDRMADVCEHPEWFDYAAPIQSYGKGIDGVRFNRLFKDGEKLSWEGHDLTVDWMPGQTEFALCLQGVIDGKRIAFTGDNLFGDPSDPAQTGHEAMVAHNSAILEEGYIVGSEYLTRIKPDLLLGGHSYVMPEPAAFIERYRRWSYDMRDAFRDLIREDDYRYGFDPFWVRAQPYRSTVRAGESIELTLHVRNFLKREQTQRIEIHAPLGLIVEPGTIELHLPAESRKPARFRVRAAPDARSGVHLIAFDITRDGHRCGELFDAIVEIQKSALKTEHFDRDPGWEGHNNRIVPKKVLMVKQDFGYSATHFAGKAAGEMGGVIQRSTTPAAYAAEIPAKTLDDKLSASGSFAITASQPGAGVFFGFFNSRQPGGSGRPIGSLGLDFDFEGKGGRLAVRLITGGNKSCGTFITPYLPGKFRPTPIKNDGTRYHWTLNYDPQAADGLGRFTFTVGSETPTTQDYGPLPELSEREAQARFPNTTTFNVDLTPGFRNEGATFDRFGVHNMMKSGGAATMFFDDLQFDGQSQNFSKDPEWTGAGNRVSFEDREVVGTHDFGFSAKSSHAGGTPGEVGGGLWRSGDFGYYADRVGPFNLEQRLEARGKVKLVTAGPDSDMSLGWFSSAAKDKERGDAENFVGIHVGGPTRIGHYFIPAFATAKGTTGKVEQGPVLTPGTIFDWSLIYDPAANGGNGEMRVTLGKESVTLALKPGHKTQGASLDRFGLFTSTAGGQMVKIYLDDLTYTADVPK